MQLGRDRMSDSGPFHSLIPFLKNLTVPKATSGVDRSPSMRIAASGRDEICEVVLGMAWVRKVEGLWIGPFMRQHFRFTPRGWRTAGVGCGKFAIGFRDCPGAGSIRSSPRPNPNPTDENLFKHFSEVVQLQMRVEFPWLRSAIPAAFTAHSALRLRNCPSLPSPQTD